jgi:hypothetical protein
MRKELIAATLGLSTLLAGAAPASAAMRCGPRDDVLQMLAEKYDETRRGVGISGPTQVLEVFASAKGTWTVVVTDPEGRTCLVASGRSWEDLREALPPEGEAA